LHGVIDWNLPFALGGTAALVTDEGGVVHVTADERPPRADQLHVAPAA
jgi:hypothetical protein